MRREIISSDCPVSVGLLPTWVPKASSGACTRPRGNPVKRENISSDFLLGQCRISATLGFKDLEGACTLSREKDRKGK